MTIMLPSFPPHPLHLHPEQALTTPTTISGPPAGRRGVPGAREGEGGGDDGGGEGLMMTRIFCLFSQKSL